MMTAGPCKQGVKNVIDVDVKVPLETQNLKENVEDS